MFCCISSDQKQLYFFVVLVTIRKINSQNQRKKILALLREFDFN